MGIMVLRYYSGSMGQDRCREQSRHSVMVNIYCLYFHSCIVKFVFSLSKASEVCEVYMCFRGADMWISVCLHLSRRLVQKCSFNNFNINLCH